MSWIVQIALIICVTIIIYKIVNEISLSKWNKNKN